MNWNGQKQSRGDRNSEEGTAVKKISNKQDFSPTQGEDIT